MFKICNQHHSTSVQNVMGFDHLYSISQCHLFKLMIPNTKTHESKLDQQALHLNGKD